jgi:hypothetical protein
MTTSDRKPTQCERLLELLRERGEAGVTPLLALERVQCFRLASRVHDLKSAGYRITTTTVDTSGGARVACYVLHEQPAQLGLSL